MDQEALGRHGDVLVVAARVQEEFVADLGARQRPGQRMLAWKDLDLRTAVHGSADGSGRRANSDEDRRDRCSDGDQMSEPKRADTGSIGAMRRRAWTWPGRHTLFLGSSVGHRAQITPWNLGQTRSSAGGVEDAFSAHRLGIANVDEVLETHAGLIRRDAAGPGGARSRTASR